jgi:SAM-dependent methyltransferase
MDQAVRAFFATEYEHNWYLAARVAVLSATIRSLPDVAPGRLIVDVGAGTGSILAHVAGTTDVLGVEGDWQLARAGRELHNVPMVIANLDGPIPLTAGSADLALSLDVLEHLDDEAAALAEVFRILRPGGTLVITVPAFQSLWSRHDELHHHKRRYSRRALLQVLGAAGFSCRRITYFNTLLFPLVYLSRRLETLRGDAVAAPTDYEKPPRVVARALRRLFELEAYVLPRWNLPVGVSLLGIATRPSSGRHMKSDR